jgi:hypothetical protein
MEDYEEQKIKLKEMISKNYEKQRLELKDLSLPIIEWINKNYQHGYEIIKFD